MGQVRFCHFCTLFWCDGNMADVVEDATKTVAEPSSEQHEAEVKTFEEAQADDNTIADEVANASSNDPSLDARAQLANLISLVHSIESSTGEPDHKKVIYEVFGTLVRGYFDLETNFTIKNSPNLLILLELFQYCDASLSVEILGFLISILKRSVTNLQICTSVGLIERVVNRLPNETDIVADKFIELVGVLAAYSITVKELKILFAALKGENGRWPKHAARLLHVLKVMPDRRGPDVYFDFTGNNGAAITVPPIAKWPHQPGFTFSTWVCLDASVITNAEKCRPYLYCFRNGKGIGYSAHFSGPMLVIESAVRSTKREIRYVRHLVGHQFHPQRWFMLTIVHTYSRFRSSEVKCYVNGELVSGGDLTMAQMNEPLDKCYIGSSPSADIKSVFRGQMGAVYLFTDALSWPVIQAIYHLGPGYKNKFQFQYEIDTPLSEQDRKVIYDGKLSASIMFTYNPIACDGQLCLESSPVTNASYFCESPHALMLEGVQAVVTHSLQTSLHSLGGVQMLFPLFAQLDYIHTENPEDREADRDICTLLLSLLCDFMKNSETSQQQMIQGRGFYVVSYLLEKCSDAAILTEEASDYLLALARFLLYQPRKIRLLGTLLDHVLFNARLWINTPFKVQLHLFSVFATDLISNPGCPDLMRREVGVNKFIDMLRTHYWVVKPENIPESGVPRPSKEELLSLRAFIMVLIKQMIVQGDRIEDCELESIFCYLCAVKEEENIVDILQFILDLMCEKPMAIIMALDRLEGIRVLFRFLSAEDEALRIYSLKLIGAFLRYCPMEKKLYVIQEFSLFSFIGEKLKVFELTLTSYNALYEVLTGRVYKQIRFDRHPEPDSTYLLTNPGFIPVMVELILEEERKQDDSKTDDDSDARRRIDIKRVFLSDLMLLLNHNHSNCRYFLQISCWQDFLLSLAKFEPESKEQVKTTDTVFSLIRLLLHHALQHEAEGWRIFVDTLAILHGQIFNRGLANKWANVIEDIPSQEPGAESDPRPLTRTQSTSSNVSDSGRKKAVNIATVDIQRKSQVQETDKDKDYRKQFFYSIIQSSKEDEENAESKTEQSMVNGDHEPPVNDRGEVVSTNDRPGGEVDLGDEEDGAGSGQNSAGKSDGGSEQEQENRTSDNEGDPETLPEDTSNANKSSSENNKEPEEVDVTQGTQGSSANDSEPDDNAGKEGTATKEEAGTDHGGHVHEEGTPDDDSEVAVADELGEKSSEKEATALALENDLKKPSDGPSSNEGDTRVVNNENETSTRDISTAEQPAPENNGLPQEAMSPDVSKAHSIDISKATNGSEKQGKEEGDASEPTSPTSPSSPHESRPLIPEFLWSPMHQRLLADVLFAIESDLQVWRSHTRKTVVDFVNAKENFIYISNLAFLISVLADSMIFCCGDLLPLLSSATSPDFSQDVIQPCGGMQLETAFSFLNRVMSLVDTVVYTSNFSFGGVEVSRSLSTGGFLRQCTRLALCCAARNRLVCRRKQHRYIPIDRTRLSFKTKKDTQDAIKAIIASTQPPTDQNVVQNMPGYLTTITDPDKLLQDMDVHRLRAAIYRDFEDSRHSQFLAITVVYFVAVLTVSKYRDILEEEKGDPPSSPKSNGETSPPEGKRSRNTAAVNLGPVRQSSSSSEAGKAGAEKNGEMEHVDLDNLGKEPCSPTFTSRLSNRMSLSEKLELTFGTSGFLLREILLDFCSFLSKVLVGSHNQELLMEGLSCLKSESVVELVMLLCSQEWQNSLQRHAGSAFMDLINEGRMVSHATRERLVLTTSEALFILQKLRDVDGQKHELFQTASDLANDVFVHKGSIHDHITSATREKDENTARRQFQKIMGVITSEYGAWKESDKQATKFRRLDNWQDDIGRRMRLVNNPYGSTHPEATLLEALETYHAKTNDGHQAIPANVNISSEEEQRPAEEEDTSDMTSSESDAKDLSPHDHVVLTASCKSISPCIAAVGTLTITTTAVYFSLDEEHSDNLKLDPKVTVYADFLHGKWSFEDIKAVFSRRYLLQNCGVEIFLTSRNSVMFVFDDHQTVRKVVRALPVVGVGPHYGLLQTRATSLASPKQLFQKSNMTQRWQQGEISNFQYLMFINKIAGRTYNDLNQYPVFPWVLKNFTSEKLDLHDPNNYRDLSKPIGALNPERLGQFLDRFNSWDKSEDIPPFHYGTHYSTCGFTLAWLIRLEPFASQFLNMQGGMFDHPGRTFSSLAYAWQNCQRDTSDVKELIPELYYLPEMFVNSNRFQFGVDDDGRVIDDVQLPPWANSPEDFIAKHRAALESDIVSSNLHKWIDLIFGFKQRGVEAERAVNVFFYLTYEGRVDLNSIQDHVMREAVEQQIKSFGQTPAQLLTEPHQPRLYRKIPEGFDYSKCAYLEFSITPSIPVTQIALNISVPQFPGLVAISCNQCFSFNRWISLSGPPGETPLQNIQIEPDPLIGSKTVHPSRLLGEPLDQSVTPTSSCFSVTADNRFIIACGYWDKSFKIFSTDTGKLHQCVFGHWDVVTSLSYAIDAIGQNANDAIIVSGSRDATLLVWHWNDKQQRISANGRPGDSASPRAILTGHETAVLCVAVSSSLGLVVSGSQDGSFLLHTLMGELLCTLVEPSSCSHPIAVTISGEGYILATYADKKGVLALFSVNGKHLASSALEDQVLVSCFSRDGNFFLTGGFSKTVSVWRTRDMQKVHSFPPYGSSIRTMSLSEDCKCLAVGLASGKVIVLEMEFSRWSLT
ncbi:neurobeachin-like [Dendronephthya gigantea]|uniref:neurobeachin-like n=1 Tax=Dendronephthya gigantea TaxID=151771 RepID=UPI00106B2D55|nr:neurobeachin-like [Dendronephthya gigantea]